MRIDIMTDIETLGTNSDSTIFQVSAIAFDIETGKHISRFSQIANIELNENPLNVTGETIKWWLKTDKELLAKLLLTESELSSEQVLRNFLLWLTTFNSDKKDIYLWGNGILFDNKMIQHQLELIDLQYPIFYRNDRDLRTLVELASVKLGLTEVELKGKFDDPTLVKHDAYDDVCYQINLATHCFQVLTNDETKERLSEAEYLLSDALSLLDNVHCYGTQTYNEISNFLHGEED